MVLVPVKCHLVSGAQKSRSCCRATLFAHAASAEGHLYWSIGSSPTGLIQRCDVDACVPETSVSGIGAIGIDVDPVEREIYWADLSVNQIRKATETGASNQLAAASQNILDLRRSRACRLRLYRRRRFLPSSPTRTCESRGVSIAAFWMHSCFEFVG
jgi:hypothetical protein